MSILSSFKFRLHKVKKPLLTSDNMSKLPKELLCCIYQQLETVDCQNSFSRTCKSFRAVALDKRCNAAWVVTRYGSRFAIYFALLSFPSRCNSQFIQYLINFGAYIPRYLIQILIQVYGKPIDGIIKQSETRQRRSSFDTVDMDLFFLKAVQQLSFDGYATLINYGYKSYGKINVCSNDLLEFLDDESSCHDLIINQHFFPAPLTVKNTNYKHVLRLAQTSPKTYDLIAPVFDFDPLARSSLWEAILLLFFDEAFRSTDPSKERLAQFHSINSTVIPQNGRHVHLTGPLTDQQIFCQIFATFFTKYPVGYCHQKTMKKLLHLLKTYVKPNFSIHVALEHMVQASIGRSDTIESVDSFLKGH